MNEMDSDVYELLELAEEMKELFKRLEARGLASFERPGDGVAGAAHKRFEAVADAAKGFRWLRAVQLSLLKAAFDKDYAAELERLNRLARTR